MMRANRTTGSNFLALAAAMGLMLAFPTGGGAAQMPAPIDIAPPPAGAPSPGGKGLPEFGAAAPEDAPAIGMISEITFPGETLAITGAGLDGARLEVWAEGGVFDIEPLRTAHNRMQAVVPETAGGRATPRSAMLVWPEKDGALGAPIRVNGATAWWAWPCRFQLGRDKTVRVFGKSLTLEGVTPAAWLTDNDGKGRALEIVRSNPYHIEAIVPDGLAPGDYRVRIHNGTGGVVGWSEAVSFSAVEPIAVPDAVFKLEDYLPKRFRSRYDLATEAVEQAIAAAVENGGGTVLFPRGYYKINKPLTLPEGVPIVLKGAGMGEWIHETHEWVEDSGTFLVAPQRGVKRGVFPGETWIELKGAGSRIEDLSLVVQADTIRHPEVGPFKVVLVSAPDVTISRSRIYAVASSAQIIWCLAPGPSNIRVEECEMYTNAGGAVHVVSEGYSPRTDLGESTDFVQVRGCRVWGLFSGGRGAGANTFIAHGGNNLIIEDNVVASYDRARGRVIGRTVLFYSHLQHNSYLANNRSLDVGAHHSVPFMDSNVSEQYLFHVRGDPKGGVLTVSDATADTLTVDPASMVPADRQKTTKGQELPVGDTLLGGWCALITRGHGVGQFRVIASGTEDGRMKLRRPWRIVPKPGDKVTVQPYFRHHLVCNNYIDGAETDPSLFAPRHKVTGVYFYHNVLDNIVANNHIENVANGVTFGQGFVTPTAWNLARDNTIRHMRGFAGGTSFKPMFYCDHLREQFRPDLTPRMWWAFCNIFRANNCEDADMAGSLGWKNFERNEDYKAESDEEGHMMPIVENNVMTGTDRGFIVCEPANWALFRGNTIKTVGGAPAIEVLRSDDVRGLEVLDDVKVATTTGGDRAE